MRACMTSRLSGIVVPLPQQTGWQVDDVATANTMFLGKFVLQAIDAKFERGLELAEFPSMLVALVGERGTDHVGPKAIMLGYRGGNAIVAPPVVVPTRLMRHESFPLVRSSSRIGVTMTPLPSMQCHLTRASPK
jgi:hypothetical protein